MAEYIIAILTIILAWQSYYQNNVVIFDRRIKLYHDFCKTIFHISILKEETERYPFTKADESGELSGLSSQDLKEIKKNCMSLYINLSAIIEEMVFVFSNLQLVDILNNKLKPHAKYICRYSAQTFDSTETRELTTEDFKISQRYIDNLFDEQGEIYNLLKKQLQLKNTEYYWSKAKQSICRKLKCKKIV